MSEVWEANMEVAFDVRTDVFTVKARGYEGVGANMGEALDDLYAKERAGEARETGPGQ